MCPSSPYSGEKKIYQRKENDTSVPGKNNVLLMCKQINLKQSWLPAFWKKKKERSKTHERLKERFLIGRNRTKRANFRGILFFKLCTTQKQKKKQWIQQTINSRVSFVPSSFRQPPTSNWHKINWILCFSVFMFYIAWKRGLPRKLARFVLFRPIKKHSFNLLCVLDLVSA